MKNQLFSRFAVSLLGIFLIVVSPAMGAVRFTQEFAPQESCVAQPEKQYRQEICLNGQWQFQPVDIGNSGQCPPVLSLPRDNAWEKTLIKIPSPWNVNSFAEGDGGDFRCFPSYPKSWESVQMGWLKRTFDVPDAWRDRRIILKFEAVAGDCEVIVNGRHVAHNFDSFLPFQVDITDAVRRNADNELLVGVRKSSLFDKAGKFGRFTYPTGSFWGMHVIGIWQDVYLLAVSQVHIDDVFVQPHVDKDNLKLSVRTINNSGSTRNIKFTAKVYQWISKSGSDVLSAPESNWKLASKPAMSFESTNISVSSGSSAETDLEQVVKGCLKLWTPDSPNLYGVIVDAVENGKVIDRKYVRFGWRQFGIKGSNVTLNGKQIQLKGDAWHFMGVPQMTRRYAWSWFRMLKDANANAVRLHAQPYPGFYLDVADEMGIMVLDESAIWASHCEFNYDPPEFWERASAHIDSLVLRDRNHPSVFGWSLSNEILGALVWAKHAPDDYAEEVCAKIIGLGERAKQLDPTRAWISSDGDDDMNGRLPAITSHYPSVDGCKALAERNKPYAVGEATRAYYGTPKEVEPFLGDRAYESTEGRMEGIAIEAYNLLAEQRSSAAYCSIFNLAWYGLQPLAIGQNDTSRAPEITDGIFFDKYVDGKPGMQPERLGPYTTTLNPGYDPKLPLYASWPLFDSVKAAYTPGELTKCQWDHIRKSPEAYKPRADIDKVGFIGDKTGTMYFNLCCAGIPIVDESSTGDVQLLVIDGAWVTPGTLSEIKANMDRVLSRGGTVLVWNLPPENLAAVNSLMPYSIELTDRSAVSLVKRGDSLSVASLSLADLYTAESSSHKVILEHGIGGEMVAKGNVILEACNADWTKWNGKPEYTKIASLIRSERESKHSGAAIVEVNEGGGRLLVSNVDYHSSSLVGKIIGALGVKMNASRSLENSVFDADGNLTQALLLGCFGADNFDSAFDTDFIPITGNPVSGDRVGDLVWSIAKPYDRFIFDINAIDPPGPQSNAAAYVSFWVYSPRPLDELLAAPNVPVVNMYARPDDGAKVWLNGKVIADEKSCNSLQDSQIKCSALALKNGWNHVMMKIVQDTGLWQFNTRLECNDISYYLDMKSALSKPVD
ncbi:MAG: sugar-binding domain-containing protein [Armatimonadota bacterium]|nr:glycoside hydrolase family 2 [bacterium]